MAEVGSVFPRLRPLDVDKKHMRLKRELGLLKNVSRCSGVKLLEDEV